MNLWVKKRNASPKAFMQRGIFVDDMFCRQGINTSCEIIIVYFVLHPPFYLTRNDRGFSQIFYVLFCMDMYSLTECLVQPYDPP